MKKTFYFGKVAHASAKKINLIEITLETRTGNWAGNVAISGGFWNSTKSDFVEAGQCLDSIAKYRGQFTPENRRLFDKLYHLWNTCHLKYWEQISEQDKKTIDELLKK